LNILLDILFEKGAFRMMKPLDGEERDKIVQEVSSIRSGILLTSWTIEAITEGSDPESRKQFELFEGTCFFLNLLAERLNDVHRRVHVE
jgi:hypothetical protein